MMAGKYNGKISFRPDVEGEEFLNNIMKILDTDSKSVAIRYALGMANADLQALGVAPTIPQHREYIKIMPIIKEAKENGNAIISVSPSYIEELKEKGVLIIGKIQV